MSYLHLMFNMSILYQPQSHIKPSKFIGNPPVKLQNCANHDDSMENAAEFRRLRLPQDVPAEPHRRQQRFVSRHLPSFIKTCDFSWMGKKVAILNEKMLENIQKSLISLIIKDKKNFRLLHFSISFHIKP